jgi:hypothetical protein
MTTLPAGLPACGGQAGMTTLTIPHVREQPKKIPIFARFVHEFHGTI